MLKIGSEEAAAVARVISSGKMFRYHEGGECHRFEERYAKYIGSATVAMTSSGTTALTAALAGLRIGPGDEVIVPAHTYMATAVAVLSVGAIPVIVDIDESITLDPDALESAIGPKTRAVIPVHMWGVACDMDRILAIASKHGLKVVEDACQCVGGGYEGRMAGSMGDAGAFSFNYFKNMTCGEGGAFCSNDADLIQRGQCTVDPCRFYWEGRDAEFVPYVYSGARASEFEGAILNVQLDRLPGMITSLRAIKKRLYAETADVLKTAPAHSLDWEACTNAMFQFSDADQASTFAAAVKGTICGNTGRHTYTEWDPILERSAGHHPAVNPYNHPDNQGCRMTYSKDMCPKSLDILARTVMVGLHPDMDEAAVAERIAGLRAAGEALPTPAVVR